MSGPALDYYGGFPVNCPDGGSYSLRLGYDTSGSRAERARYYVRVPTGSINFALIYRYAVVLQDPTEHPPSEQPQFAVMASDSITGLALPCASYSYVSGTSIPGFDSSLIPARPGATSPSSSSGDGILYKSWSTANLNLSGLGGTTVAIDFSATGCSPGGHMGYGYVDMTCGLFEISGVNCSDTATHVTLSGPDGFAGYQWFDSSTFTTSYGATQVVSVVIPTVATTYAVILTPYVGYGCPDTLYSHIQPTHLVVNPSNDTFICHGAGALINAGGSDISLPLTYAWSPAPGLSCTGCASPTATPAVSTTYTVAVTDAAGCTKTGTVHVSVGDLSSSVTEIPPTCEVYHNGSATVTVTAGTPISYVWSTSPAQTTPTATGLTGGTTYSVTVTDIAGCINVDVITDSPGLVTTLTIDSAHGPITCRGISGYITLIGLVPGESFTVSYLKDGIAHTQTHIADAAGGVTLDSLLQGTYSNIGIIGTVCPYNTVGPLYLPDPPPTAVPGIVTNSPVCLGSPLNILSSCATDSVNYYWSGPGGMTMAIQNPVIPTANYTDSGLYILTVIKDSCFAIDSTHVIIKPLPILSISSNSPVCTGDTLDLFVTSSNGASTYSWNGPEAFYSGYENPKAGNVQLATAGTYSVSVSLNGCYVMDTTDVVINLTPDAPIVDDTEYCQQDIAGALNATGTGLLWYTAATGGTGTAVDPIPSTLLQGVQTWYVSQTSIAGCEGPRTPITATIDYLASPYISISDTVICNGNDIQFFALNAGEDMTGIKWAFGSGDTVMNMNPVVHSFSGQGNFVIYATAFYKVCEAKTTSKEVTIFSAPSVNIGRDTSICPGSEPLVLADNINAGNSAASWLWNTGNTGPYLTVTTPGAYFVRVTINGCTSSDSINVANDCYMDIPNVFTPNDDGLNDYFFPRLTLTKGLVSFKMDIYNRWGQMIFETTSLDGRGWDGKLNNTAQPEGAYVYIIDATFLDGQKEHHQGNVTLIR